MKKYKWLIILGIVIITLLVISIVFTDNESKYLHDITLSKVIKKKEKGDRFILYIKQTDCEHCKVFTPRFVSSLKETKLEAYVLNIANLSEEENKEYTDTFNVKGTPTVLFFDEGSESLVRIEGEQTKEKIISKLKSAGFAK